MKGLSAAVACGAVVVACAGAAGQGIGPRPYLCENDSPFAGLTFSWFHRENFESGTLSVPGVTPSAGAPIGPGGNTDSVDCDDGMINGSGTAGHSFFYSSGPTGIRFTFNAAALGSLPTHAGVVWTDGVNPITFQAFDAQNVLLGTIVGNHADGNFVGGTAEDRFYGFVNAGGILSIFIKNGSGGIEVDHLQYGHSDSVCYPNCDGSSTAPVLNVNDFICFQAAFVAGFGYANCDGSTAAPVLNINDFVCFQQKFVAGCL